MRPTRAPTTFFAPTRIYSRYPFEILRVESWAAGKAINIPVDDMFLRWREWSDDDVDGAGEVMEETELRHNVIGAISRRP